MRRFLLLTFALALTAPISAQTKRHVEFNRDIRPILSNACFQCHGPDKAKRKADLRFDTEEGSRVDLGEHFAIVPGHPEKSVLLDRVASSDPAKRMPPTTVGPALKKEQVELLRRWIAEGAKYQKHWAFIPPVRHELPEVKQKDWVRNPIDAFVLARLEKEGLKPAAEADRVTLIRRVSLDLTGLPPTPAEVDAFLADKAPDAYEKLVDRLLASPRFGERLAHRWLDAARYADSNGYQTDGPRTMWRWRDWVIDAFNKNMPFDRFTIEQIAGDMLPGATLEQKIATGFNRNHRGNSEGGVIPEEYAVEYVVDRVDTTSTVWLGLTALCAKCHSHKYDPLTQKEFYQLFAYFNNVPEKGHAIKYGNSPPFLKTPTREQVVQRARLEARIKVAKRAWEEMQAQVDLAEARWEKADPRFDTKPGSDPSFPPFTFDSRGKFERREGGGWTFSRGLSDHFPLDESRMTQPGVYKGVFGNGLKWKGDPASVKGRSGEAAFLDGSSYITHAHAGHFGFFDRFSVAAWIKTEDVSRGTIVSRMTDVQQGDGWRLGLEKGKVTVHLVKRWLDDAIRIETLETLKPGEWRHVTFTYDGSRTAAGVTIYLDSRPARTKVVLDELYQNFISDEPLRIGKGGASFRGAIDEVHLYTRVLAPEEVGIVAEPASIPQILSTSSSRRSPVQKQKLRAFFLLGEGFFTGDRRAAAAMYQRLLQAEQDLADFDDTIPTTMVMEEMPTPRDTHILLRGEYDKKGAKVSPGLPAALPSLPRDAPNNRLGFARSLVDRSNPLTARVTVNRFWQMLFGVGVVKTVEDFGAQGEWPTHPELLDWLAVEFMEPGDWGAAPGPVLRTGAKRAWDVKRILKTIVTSATYRQSSRVSKELAAHDPDNRLLARGPRVRLPAEIIRDQALYASGLLVEKIGGPSVNPYQPPGLAKELHGTDDYVQDHGPSLYRRSLYVSWRRTVPPPVLTTFDAAGRETCVVRETRTNTPLQALNLLNDVTYVEAARVLAQRVLKGKGTDDERLSLMFRLAACRTPGKAELAILERSLNEHRLHYVTNHAAARKLIATGEYPLPEGVDEFELAAYTAVANTILNLDEVVTKE